MNIDKETIEKVRRNIIANGSIYRDGKQLSTKEAEQHFEKIRQAENEIEQRRIAIESIPDPAWLADADAGAKNIYTRIKASAAESDDPKIRKLLIKYLLKQE